MKNPLLDAKIKLAAASVLIKRVGFFALPKLLFGMQKRKKLGEPWQSPPDPNDRKDIQSRNLIRDAALLYRELLIAFPENAQSIIREVVEASAIAQLNHLVPKINAKKIAKMTKDDKIGLFSDILNKFPNADWQAASLTEDGFGYIITRCRLVELICAAGHPEIKDAFCAGDGKYFELHQPDIVFSRQNTLACGAPSCDFGFQIKNKADIKKM